MPAQRPESMQFTTISTKLIRYNEAARGDAMPVISTVTINDEPHPDYFSALDELAPFVTEVMGLKTMWEVGTVGSLKLAWTDDEESGESTFKIVSIDLARSSVGSEILISRSIACRNIAGDDIPDDVSAIIDRICDEAWAYCTGAKTAQASLFDMPPAIQSGTRSKVRPLAIAS